MSLYHETAGVLSATSSNPAAGGSLKTRVFANKGLKSPPQQVYALALETCKWSAVLKEVIDGSELLRQERKLSPVLALLLVHDFLLAKRGIALPATHGLRTTIERHKARLNAEFTKARLRRRAASVEALRQQIAAEFLAETTGYPRWVRVNTLKTTIEEQLATTFADFTRALSVQEVISIPGKCLYVDDHIPNLLAVSPSFEITKTEAYVSGAVILQDKASCFPAYLLDPRAEDGDIVDSCAAPGNKTTHLAALVHSRVPEGETCAQTVFAFEKDRGRARTLDKMVQLAGAKGTVRISFGQDFLRVDPHADMFRRVGCLLLDPSCSGSGIVGRDDVPPLHLPDAPGAPGPAPAPRPHDAAGRKRKRDYDADSGPDAGPVLVDDDGRETPVASAAELRARLAALSAFQLALLEHAFRFPAARRVTYSTCSVHAAENEGVVRRALRSDVARARGWRVLARARQPRGLREWPVRGVVEDAKTDGDEGEDDAVEVADACVRSYKDDGRGVMGFFVCGFVRDGGEAAAAAAGGDGPYLRDSDGRIVRDYAGMPTLKPGLAKRAAVEEEDEEEEDDDDDEEEGEDDDTGSGEDASSDSEPSDEEEGDGDDEWNGFGD
ncbi:S-adenosyl-L-methionine-dependent methyltransferase [Durotheca rogersii]|uniref:S-adenosyl-L-methionine-dependent methyltransferase n=1 Tax=Durotheca rogersii TaxID=419775 RepID=UPI00221EDC8D|nr:S-adenosyl-L-methionine-dependent methyltransferase [Durotheca rogersii]KAI5860548.1 S-adenosyl-L-methionine-dependent methyltransferase [Durotheca rogersii]